MHIEVFLAFFALVLISVGIFSISRKIRVPYTVLLVLAGSLLVPLTSIPALSFIRSFELTPELLFFVFLPILIFESAYNMNIREFAENVRSIGWLSVASLLISTAVVAGGVYFGFQFIGFEVPFIVALLFGALISATDPVAVLALFKEFGAPRRLSLLFEGESLFNDGTSFALFLVALEIFLAGFSGWGSVGEGIFLFSFMLAGGVLFGLLMGVLFSKLIGLVKDNEHVEITLTMLAAHFTFLLSEVISEHLVVFGHEAKFSSIIATVVAAMVIGNYGRAKISPRVEEYMEKFWGYFAFVANSLVFILMGLLFAGLSIHFTQFVLPIAIVIVIVGIARAVSIYPVVGLLNRFSGEDEIPKSWQHLLSWGSLRGALAVTMVLLIPDGATVAGWQYPFSVKEFIAALTIGCIYFTLFIKATTMSGVMKRLRVGNLHALEEAQYHQARSLIHAQAIAKLDRLMEKRYVDEEVYRKLRAEHDAEYILAQQHCRERFSESDRGLAEQALRAYALGIERHFLRVLFRYEEITEPVYKRILAKLHVQLTRVERGEEQLRSLDENFPEDWFEQAVGMFRRLFLGPVKLEEVVRERYMRYRAQNIIARKVVKHLSSFVSQSGSDSFGDRQTFEKVIALYREFEQGSAKKRDAVFMEHRKELEALDEAFGRRGLFKAEEHVLDDLTENEMISPKLSILLYNELKEREFRRI